MSGATTAKRRSRRVDWENIHCSRNGTLTRTNMCEVIGRHLEDFKRIRLDHEARAKK